MKYTKFSRTDPHPEIPFAMEEQAEEYAGIVAILMLVVALILWWFA